MKRYRTFGSDFDFRARHLATEIQDDWEDAVKESWRRNKENTSQGLIYEFGAQDADRKIFNFTELGVKPWSVVAYHNKFSQQARVAFVMGAYYPALTAACALGERILNQLVIDLRDEFQHTDAYRDVRRRNSFEDWNLMIRTLQAWGVLRPNVIADFGRLVNIRNNALHYHPDTDEHDRRQALTALQILGDIIDKQFGAFGDHPWFIEGTLGAVFIRKSMEGDPFIRNVYLPNCVLVGPCHTMSHNDGYWFVHDAYDYSGPRVTDEEFRDLFNAAHRDSYCESISRVGGASDEDAEKRNQRSPVEDK